ncbi:MAG: hypothetical protein JNL80_12395 [Phycisphaerae bacterium]|nr:hypothetical protein [Phycisphaerae bacterium]
MPRPVAIVAATMIAVGLVPTTLAAPQATPAPAATTKADPLDAALALIPKDAIAFVVVPNPKRASDDLQQCLERMNRPEASLGGRPIDQAKAYFGMSASFDDKAPLVLSVFRGATEGGPARMLLSLPATDPKAFLDGNLTKAPEIAPDAYRTADGQLVYGRAGERHAHLAPDPETVRGYAPGEGIGLTIRSRLGERGTILLGKGDLVAWAGSDAIRPALRTASERAANEMPSDAPFAAQANEMRATATRLLEGLDDGLLAIDVDPLGLGVRTFAKFADGSELAGLTAGGKDREPRFDRVPKQPFYAAGRIDIDGLGGGSALEALLAKLPGTPGLPTWLSKAKDSVRAIQLGIFPSKLALAAGGLLNDSVLFLETAQPDLVRDGLREAILSLKGEQGGLRREPTWEADRTLKSGDVADAFEVAETVVSSKDTNPVDLSMRRMITQGIYGSRGLVGFVKRQQDGVTMTFSQRADVLDRATKTASGAPSLSGDPVIGAYREWLIDRPDKGRADVELYIGVGQFGKLFKQVLTLVPGGDQMQAPDIPTSVEPVAFALEVDSGAIESATVIPSGVLGVAFDGVKSQVMGGQRSRPASKPAATPSGSDAPAKESPSKERP